MVSAGVVPLSKSACGLSWLSFFSQAMRTSKNSSKLEETMHKKRNRSKSGTPSSRACASTRRLNASRLSSRQRMVGWFGIRLPEKEIE